MCSNCSECCHNGARRHDEPDSDEHEELDSCSEEEWNADGKGRGPSGNDHPAPSGGRDEEVRRGGGGGARAGRRDEPRRHTLSGDHHHQHQGGSLTRSMDLEMSSKSQRRKSPLPRGYPPPSTAMLFDEDPGIMSEVETSSTGFRRGGKQRSSLPVVRTPSKTLERPLGKTSGVLRIATPQGHPGVLLQHHPSSKSAASGSGGLVFLQYRNETKRALLPNEITSIDTVKALFVRSFPKQLTMEYLDSPHVKIYIHDSSKDMFYELEDLRSHLRDIRDRSVLRLFESADMNGGVLPGAGVGVVAPAMWDQDQSYFSEPEFDSEYQHQHIHKTKTSSKASSGVAPQPYYMTHSYPPGGSQPSGAPATLPRGGPLLRAYSPAVVPPVPAERIKSLPQTGVQPPPKPVRTYQQAKGPSNVGPRVPDRIYGSFITPPSGRTTNLYSSPGFPSGADRLHSESGYMSSPERGGPRAYPGAYPSSGQGYEDPYYSQYASRSGSITPVIDEEASDTELMDESYSLYGVKLPTGRPVAPQPRSQFPAPAVVPYDATRIRVENMERQLANLTGLVQKALTQTPTPREYLQVPTATSRDANYRNAVDEYDKHSSSSSASLPDDSYLRTDTKPPKLGKDKSVSFEKSVSFSDEPPDMNSPKQHSPQHTERTERERHKPAPPPKPVSLSPGQYEGRHVYRDLHLTPEMYNQLRGLQKKAKDLRQEVRNLRRMTQAQAHTVRETIRDTFIKIRTMLLMGGDDAWMSGDAEKVRLNREEDAYKQEMLRLEKDLTELESTVEELRGNVINRKTRVNMSDVENMALILSKSSKTVADLKVRFPSLQEGMKSLLSSEMEKVVREEKFLKEEPERLESALRRCKKLTGTLVTLKRLASVQEQRLPPTTTDGRLSPTMGTDSDPPITPPAHGKTSTIPARGVLAPSVGSGSDISLSRQRPENALDALLDELQTFARPPHNPTMSEIGRKGSIDSAHPPSGPSSLPGTSSLRRLHSYPSSSDGGGNSPPTVPLSRLQVTGPADPPKSPATSPKPPVPERNSELLSHLAGRRVPPPPPPRTSSRSPLASPTSPSLPPRGQHPPNQPQMGVGGGTLLRRGGPGRSSLREPLRGSPGISLPLEPKPPSEETGNTLGNFNPLSASNSSSCESVNSQEGLQNKSGNKARQEILEQRHQELLRKQRALQEQYARLQQLQRGGAGGLTVIPPPDLLLKKTGSESNLLAKMGLGHGLTAAAPISGSLTHLAAVAAANQQPIMQPSGQQQQQKSESNTSSATAGTTAEATSTAPAITSDATTTTTTTTNKIYETDIL
ncbi:coiled-coil domain-containing protein AGAP005037 isoform X4 [Anabrus simplex]|uniref:coiled-coil domain-containing protein AGAP005037 isoform X4 n=1 Tax=Anabrus simplex TaxID=316456 RepID=UPI0035A36742